MKSAPLPDNERERLAVLRDYNILDTPPEEGFDDFTKLAAAIFEAPISLLSFLDEKRLWFKSTVGLPVVELPRDLAFCGYAIIEKYPFIIQDSRADSRFSDHPLVVGDPKVRFYAGAPLITPSGHSLGTLCIIDREPRKLTPEQSDLLQMLANRVMAQLEARRAAWKHRQMALDLQASRDRFDLAVRGASNGFWDWDIRTGEVYYSPRFKESLGFEDQYFKPRVSTIMHRLHPEDRQRVVQAFRDHQLLGAPLDLECRLQNRQGDHPWFLVKGQAVWDATGRAIRMVGSINDITRRKEAERVLVRQAATLREQAGLLNLTHDPIVVCDMNDAVLFWNHGAEIMYGWTTEEARGRNLKELLRSITAEPWDEIRSTLLQRDYWEGEIKHRKKDGLSVIVQSRWALQRDDQGRPQAILRISNDISKQKRVEAELQRAVESAEAASRAKSEFLANVSHEIRTPMNGIIGMSQLLLHTGLGAQQRDYAQTIHASADTLLNIVNEILDFSKIEAGRLTFENTDFDLAVVVEGTLDLFAASSEAKRNEMVSMIEPEVPRQVRGDPGRLRQVLANLVSNANKFTDEGQVILRVSALPHDNGQSFVRFEVCDTGIGISSDIQAKLFQPFTQADGSTTRKYGGTGLGLAISKRLVNLMDGEIGVMSSGTGSTFWFTLPLREPSHARSRGAGFEALRDVAALLILSKALDRQVLSELLSARGMRVASAASPQEAHNHLEEFARAGTPCRVVIMDLAMAVGDKPLETVSLIPGSAGPRPAVIALANSGSEGAEQMVKEAGFATCLTKPVKQFALLETIAALLMADATETITVLQPSALPPAFPAVSSSRTLRILVAEDNSINQKVILGLLLRLGFTAQTVANGREVLAALQQSRFELILMDCQMPEMDGYETTLQIRRSEKLSGGTQPLNYIVAMTASAIEGSRERCIETGMDDYMSKPVRLSDVEAALKRYFSLHPVAATTDIFASPQARPSTRLPSPPDPALATEPVVSLEMIEELRQMEIPGETDALGALITIFQQNAEADLGKLGKAIEDGQIREVNRLAHKLKGSCGNFGARKMFSLCHRLEQAAAAQRLDGAPGFLREIQRAYSELVAQLGSLQHGP